MGKQELNKSKVHRTVRLRYCKTKQLHTVNIYVLVEKLKYIKRNTKKSYFEKCLIDGVELVNEGRMIHTDMEHIKNNNFNQRKEKDIGKIGKVRNLFPVSEGGFRNVLQHCSVLIKYVDMKLIDKNFQNFRT
jgi:hypothetical protein